MYRLNKEDKERFYSKISDIGSAKDCREWKASCFASGYGQFWLKGKNVYAHRIVYFLHYGIFDKKSLVLHKCDNKKCCNPLHLFLGTYRDNIMDAINKKRFIIKKGEECSWSKLTEKDVKKIRRLYSKTKHTIYSLSKLFDICYQTVSLIINRKRWKHI